MIRMRIADLGKRGEEKTNKKREQMVSYMLNSCKRSMKKFVDFLYDS